MVIKGLMEDQIVWYCIYIVGRNNTFIVSESCQSYNFLTVAVVFYC